MTSISVKTPYCSLNALWFLAKSYDFYLLQASGVGVTEAVFAALLRSAAKSRSYEYVTAIMKVGYRRMNVCTCVSVCLQEMRHSEVSAGPQVLKTLHRLLADPPSVCVCVCVRVCVCVARVKQPLPPTGTKTEDAIQRLCRLLPFMEENDDIMIAP